MFITRTCYHDVGIIILLSYDYNGVVKTVKVKTPNLIFSPTCIWFSLKQSKKSNQVTGYSIEYIALFGPFISLSMNK